MTSRAALGIMMVAGLGLAACSSDATVATAPSSTVPQTASSTTSTTIPPSPPAAAPDAPGFERDPFQRLG